MPIQAAEQLCECLSHPNCHVGRLTFLMCSSSLFYAIQKPVVSHGLVKDFTLNTAENNPTVDSTSLSRPLNSWPRADLSSAACRKRITATTTAN
jgi:hypothetical protein